MQARLVDAGCAGVNGHGCGDAEEDAARRRIAFPFGPGERSGCPRRRDGLQGVPPLRALAHGMMLTERLSSYPVSVGYQDQLSRMHSTLNIRSKP